MQPGYRDVVTAPGDESVAELAARMHRRTVGCVIVTDPDDRAVGIVTDRDLAVKVPTEHDEWDSLRAVDVMSTPLIHARADSTASEIIEKMREHRVRRVPLLDEEDRLIEVVSVDDFFCLIVGELDELEGVLERYRPSL